jgi:hypothetical protein
MDKEEELAFLRKAIKDNGRFSCAGWGVINDPPVDCRTTKMSRCPLFYERLKQKGCHTGRAEDSAYRYAFTVMEKKYPLEFFEFLLKRDIE